MSSFVRMIDRPPVRHTVEQRIIVTVKDEVTERKKEYRSNFQGRILNNSVNEIR